MKLYTKNGDGGFTSLFDGQQVRKDEPLINAYGSVDELNACLGLVASACEIAVIREGIPFIQDRLFAIGAELATPTKTARGRGKIPFVVASDTTRLEDWIDSACEPVPALHSFILPGGCETAARLHLARAVCRRVERQVVPYVIKGSASQDVLIFLNRLSDLLFAWARLANHQAGVPDTPWPQTSA